MKVMKGGNMKNVMKKLAGLLMVLSVALFAGCSDSSDRANEAPQTAKTYTVSGKISIGNAVPANVAKSIATSFAGAGTNARTATSSFDLDTYEKEAEWVAEATSVDGDDNDENDIHILGEIDPTEKTYSFKLPQGTWTLMLALEGEYKEYHVDFLFYNEFEETVGSSNVSKNVVLFPRYSLNKNGALNLTIKDETTGSKIDTVTCELNYLNWATMDEERQALIEESLNKSVETLKKSLETLKVPQAFSDGKVTIELVSAGSVTIDLGDVPAGSYEATFTFKDSSGNKLYACKENITVFSGWTTDTWLGAGAHLKKNAEGVTNFVITDDLIYDVEIVPDTNMVLYDVEVTARDSLGAVEAATYTYSLRDSEETTPIFETENLGGRPFCFDNDGNVYFLDSFIIKSSRTGFPSTGVACNVGGNSCSGIMIDHASNIMYGWQPGGTMFKLYEYSTLISSNGASLGLDITDLDNVEACWDANINVDGKQLRVSETSPLCVINNGIVYAYCYYNYDSSDIYIVELNLSTKKAKATSLTLPSSSGQVTDMLYQDGVVYMLYRDVSDTSSCGALIRYDVKFGSIKTLGLTNNELKGDDFANVKLGVYYNNSPVLTPKENPDDDTESIPIVFDGNYPWTSRSVNYTLKDFIKTLRTPAPLSETPDLTVNEFFGPVKFIAIKPKRLVIADDGIAFYTDNDLLKYKNVNRIVTVDLESFSIIEASLVNVFFNGDDSDVKPVVPIPNTGSTATQDVALREGRDAMLPAEGGSDTYSYINSNDEAVTLSDVIFGIPCGD